MHPFRLNIASPCQQDWNGMTGTEKRRHCASCNHEVVALAEMTPEDAIALVRSAKPHSLCLRVEHDDVGNVMFRQTSTVAQAAPLLVLTLGASLLLAGCNGTSSNIEKDSTTQSADATKAQNADATAQIPDEKVPLPPALPPDKLLPIHAQPASSSSAQPGLVGDDRHVKPSNQSGVRVTTGCACAVGDKLCDCL